MSVKSWLRRNIKGDMIIWQGLYIGSCVSYTSLKEKKNGIEHVPEVFVENGEVKLLWDMNIQCYNVFEGRRPDIVVVSEKKKKCIIEDIAIPGDCRIHG